MRPVFILVLLLALSACGPRVEGVPEVSLPKRFAQDRGNYTLPSPPERWWTLFGSPELDGVVREVLARNHDLRRARFRLAELAARLRVARARRFPEVNLAFSGRRTRNTLVEAPEFNFIFGEFRTQAQVSYEVDLWRKLSSGEKAAYFEMLSAENTRLALAQSLVAETVSEYLRAGFTLCELDLLSREIRTAETRLRLLRKRLAEGLLSASALMEEQARVAALRAQDLALQRSLEESLQKLQLLSGVYPSGNLRLREARRVCALDLPLPPPGLPSRLLRRRPDIRAAEARLKAAAEKVKIARAARFPRLLLTAEEGRVSNALKDLLQKRNRIWTLTFGLTQPLFNAGRLGAEERAAREALREAREEYLKTVLTAFKEVEFALLSEERLRGILRETRREYADQKRRVVFARERFRAGLLDLPRVLAEEMTLFETQRKLLEARKDLLLNRVFLFKALGGDFGFPEKEGT